MDRDSYFLFIGTVFPVCFSVLSHHRTIPKYNMIGPKVRQFRAERRLSQQELSNRLETEAVYICRGSISRIEDGSRTVTDLELYGLSKILHKPIESFFED